MIEAAIGDTARRVIAHRISISPSVYKTAEDIARLVQLLAAIA